MGVRYWFCTARYKQIHLTNFTITNTSQIHSTNKWSKSQVYMYTKIQDIMNYSASRIFDPTKHGVEYHQHSDIIKYPRLWINKARPILLVEAYVSYVNISGTTQVPHNIEFRVSGKISSHTEFHIIIHHSIWCCSQQANNFVPMHSWLFVWIPYVTHIYNQTSNISHSESPNLDVSRFALQLSLRANYIWVINNFIAY